VTARLAVAGVLVVISPLGGLAQPTRVGDEFLVNTYTTGPQRFASVCTLDGADFVVAWEDGRANYFGLNHGSDGSETAAIARRLGGEPPSGDPDFLVNTYTTGRQGQPSVACLDDGGFVVVWNEAQTYFDPPPEGRFGVLGRRYDEAGVPGTAFPVEVPEVPPQFGDPPDEGSVCRGPDDGFVVVWNVLDETTVRRYDAEGAATPAADLHLTQLNNPKCCGSDDGFVLVGWQGDFTTGTPEVFAQRFSATGALAGSRFTVNTYTTGHQTAAAVACNGDGRFVVVWESAPSFIVPSEPQDGDGAGVFGQLFEADGDALGPEFQVHVVTSHDQIEPSVAMDAAGRFVVAWTTYSYDDILEIEDADVFARAFDAEGAPANGEFQVNTYTTETSGSPSAAIGADGDIVIAWHTSNDGDDHSISAQRYSLGVPVTTTTLPPVAACGDPLALHASSFGTTSTGRAVTASDALYTLQAAVGIATCAICVCDVDGGGSVAATDALAILRYAVGQPVTLNCPAC
jgi:hypothetical protein